jgi:hypothetical protein
VPEIYRSARITAIGPQESVVVIQCSDPRYQPHFHDFVRNGLHVHRYALLAIPGGAQCLTLVDYLPKFAWSGWRWLKFLEKLMSPKRVILIAHDDCRWYLDNRFAESPEKARQRQVQDLQRVRGELLGRFGQVRIDSFYATLAGEEAVFESIAP